MTLPTQEEIDRVHADRPGDQIYPKVKDKIQYVGEKEEEITTQLVDLILNDLIFDFSVANSLDEIGKVLTYLAQERGIEAPEFTGDMLMKQFSRISKLKLGLEYAKIVGISEKALDAVLRAEVERLWGDSNVAALKKLLASKVVAPKTASPSTGTGVRQEPRVQVKPRGKREIK